MPEGRPAIVYFDCSIIKEFGPNLAIWLSEDGSTRRSVRSGTDFPRPNQRDHSKLMIVYSVVIFVMGHLYGACWLLSCQEDRYLSIIQGNVWGRCLDHV